MKLSPTIPSVLAAALLLEALAGCAKQDNEPGPGGVTVGEARALDDAAQMIEAQRLPAQAVPSPAVSAVPAK